jgi:hypothetical protein
MEIAMESPRCPHCNEPLKPFELPDNTGWENEFHVACFNDTCSYYRQGWEWMQSQFGVKSSYRYRINPATGKASPLAVWSPQALRDRILDAEIAAREVSG